MYICLNLTGCTFKDYWHWQYPYDVDIHAVYEIQPQSVHFSRLMNHEVLKLSSTKRFSITQSTSLPETLPQQTATRVSNMTTVISHSLTQSQNSHDSKSIPVLLYYDPNMSFKALNVWRALHDVSLYTQNNSILNFAKTCSFKILP